MFRTIGIGGDAGTIKDIAQSGLVIIVGCNPTEGHPVLATRIKRAHKLHGQKLIVADLRKTEMAERSDVFISPKQGTDQVWLMAVTKYMIDQGWHDQEFINENVNFFEDFKESLEEYTLEYAEEVTGISKETLIQMAEMIRDADGTCILWGMGVTQNTGGSDTSAAISNLLLATGTIVVQEQVHTHFEVTITYKVLVIWVLYQDGFQDISTLLTKWNVRNLKLLTE